MWKLESTPFNLTGKFPIRIQAMLFCYIDTGRGPYYLIELNNVMFCTLKIQEQSSPVGFFLFIHRKLPKKEIEII